MLLDAIERELDSAEPAHDRATRHHLGLLAVWLERQAALQRAESRPRRMPRAGWCARYTALLERDFRSGQGVADYAAALGVTPTHLTRVLQPDLRPPALDLLQDRLIFEARRLLTRHADAGRTDRARPWASPRAAYFTRAFQHRTGSTPSAFRRAP